MHDVDPAVAVDVEELFGSTTAWSLADDVVHANHGSFGAVTTATQVALADGRTRVAANPMAFFVRAHPELLRDARRAVAGLVGADAGSVALVANATVGIDVALRVLPWGPSSTMVTTDQLYPSVAANVARRAATSATRIQVVATDPTTPSRAGDDVVAAMADAATRGPVGVVVDQVASATAMAFPVADIARAARDLGATMVVDGAHAPGQLAPRDVVPAVDAWTGNLHKWACAPPSLAALFVHPRHHDTVGSVVPSWHDHLDFPANAAWQGTSDPGPVLVAGQVVAQAVAILGRAPDIEALVSSGAGHVAAAVGGTVLPGTGWMRAIALPPRTGRLATSPAGLAHRGDPGPVTDADLAARAVEVGLVDRGVEAKVTAWRDLLLLRLSCHAYSSARDHDRLAEALVAVLG